MERVMQFHIVREPTQFFNLINVNVRTFTLKKDDCGYQIGDVLVMREWAQYGDECDFTFEWCCRKVCYILRPFEDRGLATGFVILGLTVCDSADTQLARKLVKEREAYEKKSRMEARVAEKAGTARSTETRLST
jgi:Domain of unknown function (DUF3850)